MGPVLNMAGSLLLDTDVLVAFFRGHNNAVAFVTANSFRIILSSIVVAELYAGVRDEEEISVLEDFVSLFRVIPVTSDIARKGGLYKRDYAKSHGVGLADAIIAATCDAENATLQTFNIKHYPMIKGLTPPYRK
ncbi:MAG: type II toxin-antitoxin system VapC family toxin [Desulfobacterales bacterium]